MKKQIRTGVNGGKGGNLSSLIIMNTLNTMLANLSHYMDDAWHELRVTSSGS